MVRVTRRDGFRRTARVVHAMPGRLRLRLDGVDRGPVRDVRLAGALDRVRDEPGIRDVRLNAEARSLLIRYDPDRRAPDEIAALLVAAGLEIAEEDPAASTQRSPVVPRDLDRRLLRTLVISGASLFAARQVGAVVGGAATIPAYLAIWFALRRLVESVAPPPR